MHSKNMPVSPNGALHKYTCMALYYINSVTTETKAGDTGTLFIYSINL